MLKMSSRNCRQTSQIGVKLSPRTLSVYKKHGVRQTKQAIFWIETALERERWEPCVIRVVSDGGKAEGCNVRDKTRPGCLEEKNCKGTRNQTQSVKPVCASKRNLTKSKVRARVKSRTFPTQQENWRKG